MSTRALLGSVVLGLLVAACSGEDEDMAGPVDAPAATASASSSSSSSGSPAAPAPSPSTSSSSSSSSGSATVPELPPAEAIGPGSIDKTFGVNGIAAGLPEAVSRQLAVDAKGNYLVTGLASKTHQGFVARYSPEGKIDETLGEFGVLQFTMGSGLSNTTLASWNVPLPDGSFLVIGGSVSDQGVFDSSAKMFDATGKPVTSWAKNGEYKLLSEAIFTHGARLADGSFIIAGLASAIATSDLMVLRLTPQGKLDLTFGSNGIAYLPRPGGQMSVGFAIDALNRILVAGVSTTPNSPGFVWRLTPTGKTDPWFGGGVVETPIGARSLSIGKDNTVYVAGQTADPQGSVIAIDQSGKVLPAAAMTDLPTELSANKNGSFRVVADDAGLFVIGGWATGKAANGDFDNGFSMRLDASGKVTTLPKSGFVTIPNITTAHDMIVTEDRAVILGGSDTRGFALTRVYR